jgi:hypothetical protein
MATLFRRRYTRAIEDVGSTEKILGVCILLLVAVIVIAFAVRLGTGEDVSFDAEESVDRTTATPPGEMKPEDARGTPEMMENPFPGCGLEGWQPPERVDRFSAENLYTKIDGQADAYLRFHVAGLTFGTYRHEADAARAIDVYWYDMGAPANALGMYESEEPPGVGSVAVGDKGYQVGGAVLFCKGAAYVQVLPSSLDDADARAALRIAECLDDRIKE